MTDSPAVLLAAGGPKTRPRGRVLAPARYRHPGDVIRLIAAALVLAVAGGFAAAAALMAGITYLAGPGGPAPAGLRQGSWLAGAGFPDPAVLAGLAALAVAAAPRLGPPRGPPGHRRAPAAAAGAGPGHGCDRRGRAAGRVRGAGPADGPRGGGSGAACGRGAGQPGDRAAARCEGVAAVRGDHRRREWPVREGFRLRTAGRRPAVPGLARHPAARRRRHQARGLAVQGRRA